MTGELTKAEGQSLTALDIRAQVNLIQQVMEGVMQGPSKENPNGVHYGKIPGCGDKLTLLKAGAEKLLSTFRIAAEPVVEDLSTFDEARYRVTVKGISMTTGAFLGAGIGECSSNEEKYKWKKATCDEEFDAMPEDRRRIKWFAPSDKPKYSVKQIRTNPADVANTVLKMAKKRGQIDMTLTVTAASDIFTQDYEEPEDVPNTGAPAPAGKPATDKPKTTAEAAATPKADATVIELMGGKVISITPHRYKAKVDDKGKPIAGTEKVRTDYEISNEAGEKVIISQWKEPDKSIVAGLFMNARNVKVGEFKGTTTYTAETIAIAEQPEK